MGPLYNGAEGLGIGEILFRFRVVYGRYPRDKEEILVHRFVSIAFIATTLFVSCAVSSTPRNKYHSTYDAQLGIHLYESVEEWPKYNNEPYAIGLSQMFNKTFSYIREENDITCSSFARL